MIKRALHFLHEGTEQRTKYLHDADAVDSRLAHHIMNTQSRLLRHLQDVDSKVRCQVFSGIHIFNEKCKCQPIGNKESKNKPI
jgi:hypothetical protein